MSANELLNEIEALPDDERQWLMEKLFKLAEKEETDWARFSTAQLSDSYGPEDSIYDQD